MEPNRKLSKLCTSSNTLNMQHRGWISGYLPKFDLCANEKELSVVKSSSTRFQIKHFFSTLIKLTVLWQ